jgi:hypothetical protein
MKNLSRLVKRMNVKVRQKRQMTLIDAAMKTMNAEQKEIFNLVVDLVKKHPETILYDKISNETLIVQPDLLVTIYKDSKDNMVAIDNHHGFHKQWFYEAAYHLITEIVNREAHRYRRKLKYTTRINIQEFIKGIIEKRQVEEIDK